MTSERLSALAGTGLARPPAAWLAPITAILIAVFCAGCGDSPARRTVKKPEPSKKAATPEPSQPALVNPEAMGEFEAGTRAIRLAGQDRSTEAYAQARKRFQRTVELDSTMWEAWHNLGVVHYAEGDDDSAVTAFTRVLEVNPSHTESLLARAEAHRRAGRTDDARRDYEDSIERSSDENAVKRNATARLASLLREGKQYDDAVEVVRETLRTAGANAKVYVELGMVYLAQGHDELAELVLTKAAKIDPKEPSVHNALALLALSHGRSQEAFNRFDHATSLDPNYLDARFNKATVLVEAGDFGRAKSELSSVAELNPDDLDARVALGVACRGLGEYDQAKRHWQEVVKRAPKRSQVRGDALFNLAILQMNFLEDEKAARAALDQYLQEAPQNHEKRQVALDKKKELGL